MKLTFKFAAMAVLLLLAGACSNDDPVARSVIPEDDPISRILHEYLDADQTTRTTLNDFRITNVERHNYTLSEDGVIATEATRNVGEEFEVARADFESNGKSGYAYLTTHPEAEGVYFFTDNGTINDTVQNKALAAFIDAVPAAVGSTIENGTPTFGGVTDLELSVVGSGPLLTTAWHQNAPFNNLCPQCYCASCNGKRMYAGCGAIATAQVIAYCRRFTGAYYGNGTMIFNTLTNPDINWLNTSETIKNRVAAFVHEVAIGIQTQFGDKGAGSTLKSIQNYLEDLGYTCEIKRGNFDQNLLIQSIMPIAPSRKKAPVIVQGLTRSGDGHAWVIDGIRYTDPIEFHLNWGYGSRSNAWASSSLLTTVGEKDYMMNNAALYITNF